MIRLDSFIFIVKIDFTLIEKLIVMCFYRVLTCHYYFFGMVWDQSLISGDFLTFFDDMVYLIYTSWLMITPMMKTI